MKIGILTYYAAHNYGAVLQAYGLKTYLSNNLENEVDIVGYFPHYHQQMYRIFPWSFFKKWSFERKVKFILKFPFLYCDKVAKARLFEDFITRFLKPNNDYKNIYFDYLIYGSDQIWRYQDTPLFKGYNEIYFGSSQLLAKKRISYSASMGKMDQFEYNHDFFRRVMQNFNSVAVRERELKIKIQPFCNKEVVETLDPVFLLSKNEWLKLVTRRMKTTKYILVYNLLDDPKLTVLADKLSKEKNLEIIEITGTVKVRWNKKSNISVVDGPLEFLSWIYYAEYVVTSSFHGVVFSILFEKNFLTFLPSNSGRVKSLLESLNLQSLFVEDEDIEFEKIFPIDYAKVNSFLQPLIEGSKFFLNKALNN